MTTSPMQKPQHPIHSILTLPPLALDRAAPTQAAIDLFLKARKVENAYARRLRKIARHVGDVVSDIWDGSVESASRIKSLLDRYAETIRPWAEAVGSRMVADVNARDHRAWMAASRRIGQQLRTDIDTGPVGEVMRARLADQVDLITSLPREAAERVHRMTLERISNGKRAASLADEIMRTGAVTRSRANTIARTETSRTATELTRARALSVGSTHFVWRTVGDSDVRDDHKKLDGKVFAWDDPPVSDSRTGARSLPGAIYNCRCYARPVIADED